MYRDILQHNVLDLFRDLLHEPQLTFTELKQLVGVIEQQQCKRDCTKNMIEEEEEMNEYQMCINGIYFDTNNNIIFKDTENSPKHKKVNQECGQTPHPSPIIHPKISSISPITPYSLLSRLPSTSSTIDSNTPPPSTSLPTDTTTNSQNICHLSIIAANDILLTPTPTTFQHASISSFSISLETDVRNESESSLNDFVSKIMDDSYKNRNVSKSTQDMKYNSKKSKNKMKHFWNSFTKHSNHQRMQSSSTIHEFIDDENKDIEDEVKRDSIYDACVCGCCEIRTRNICDIGNKTKFIYDNNYMQELLYRLTTEELKYGRDNGKYLINNCCRILNEEFEPTFVDLLECHVRSTGLMFENHVMCKQLPVGEYEKQDIVFRVVDVGGHRNERKKWTYVLQQDNDAIVFVVSAASFCQVLFEDFRRNAMRESLHVWQHIIDQCNTNNLDTEQKSDTKEDMRFDNFNNNENIHQINSHYYYYHQNEKPLHNCTQFVLLINKIDLFYERYHLFADYFPEYVGDMNATAILNYIKQLYINISCVKNINVHCVVAQLTDEDEISTIDIDLVRENIMTLHFPMKIKVHAKGMKVNHILRQISNESDIQLDNNQSVTRTANCEYNGDYHKSNPRLSTTDSPFTIINDENADIQEYDSNTMATHTRTNTNTIEITHTALEQDLYRSVTPFTHDTHDTQEYIIVDGYEQILIPREIANIILSYSVGDVFWSKSWLKPMWERKQRQKMREEMRIRKTQQLLKEQKNNQNSNTFVHNIFTKYANYQKKKQLKNKYQNRNSIGSKKHMNGIINGAVDELEFADVENISGHYYKTRSLDINGNVKSGDIDGSTIVEQNDSGIGSGDVDFEHSKYHTYLHRQYHQHRYHLRRRQISKIFKKQQKVQSDDGQQSWKTKISSFSWLKKMGK